LESGQKQLSNQHIDDAHARFALLSADEVTHLLHYSLKLSNAGKPAGARTILRTLARHYPHDSRVWLYLAQCAETPIEQHQALEHTLALDPEHEQARERLNRLHAQYADLLEDTRPTHPQTRSKKSRTYQVVTMLVAVCVLVLILVITINTSLISFSALPLPGNILPAGLAPSHSQDSAADVPTSMPTVPPTPRPEPTLLPAGAILTQDDWFLRFIRPTDTKIVTRSIGPFQPDGHFVLVLLALANNAPIDRHIPADMIRLIDAEGHAYTPTLQVSTHYLDIYGRGHYGDLALEDTVPAGGGMVSVPLLFDVPLDARKLLLTTNNQQQRGWSISNQPVRKTE